LSDNDIQNKFLNDFRHFENLHANGLSDLRNTAIQHFSRLGFPTMKNEEWKYTNIAPLLNSKYSLPVAGSFELTGEEIRERLALGNEVSLVVLENGRINESASDTNLRAGLSVKNLYDEKHNPVVQKHFSKYADIQTDAFAALNTAFVYDGLFLHIQKGNQVEKPLVIVQVASAREEAVIIHNRILLLAETGSAAKIASVTLSRNNSTETFVNAVNEIVIEENTTVEFDIFQNENEKAFQICNTFVCQKKDSKFTINTSTLGGRIVRNKLNMKLDAENCETHLYGLYVADGVQVIDNHSSVMHAKPYSNSNQLYKGIVGGKAHGVFNGKILVEKDAQKTNAYQSNKNILLSDDAVINAKPQLEIFADDVKCTHGATTGQMDEESVFYLRSRGINEVAAKALLNKAFASDVLNNITIASLRDFIFQETETKLIKANA
jgi:Fe-S cluster assembly protein SufD